MGATKLLTYEELFTTNTFNNLLKFDGNYAFNITDAEGNQMDLLNNEYLPQLKDTMNNIQPYQKFNALDTDLKLDTITSVPSADGLQVNITMKFENPNNLNLTRVKIENDDMTVKPGTWNTTVDERGLTVVNFIATPNKAFDSYKIESIFYEKNGQENEKEVSSKVVAVLYKKISNASEWNSFFDNEGKTYPGQNVKITGNIDFNTVDHISSHVVIGRIEADTPITISNVNLTLEANSGFINEIKTSFKNINFDTCKINGNGSYIGLIGILRAGANNCKFSNIEINCTGNNDYIGVISRTISGSFNNINLNNIKCYGRHFVGGLCGHTTSLGSSSNIIGTYMCVTASGNYIGGLFGLTQGTINNISAYQYSDTGRKNGDAETPHLVKGNQRVGGSMGQYQRKW